MGASRPTDGGASETPRCYCLSLFKHAILRSSKLLVGGLAAQSPLPGASWPLEAQSPLPGAGGPEALRGPRPPRVAGAAGVVAPALLLSPSPDPSLSRYLHNDDQVNIQVAAHLCDAMWRYQPPEMPKPRFVPCSIGSIHAVISGLTGAPSFPPPYYLHRLHSYIY